MCFLLSLVYAHIIHIPSYEYIILSGTKKINRLFPYNLFIIGFSFTHILFLRVMNSHKGKECALNALAVDDPLEYAKLYLDGPMQM